jgi:hypothetical protein
MKSIFVLLFIWITSNYLNAQQLIQAEYFTDTDPGFGKGTGISFEPGEVSELSMNIPVSGLEAGIHTLFVRVKDDNGKWSQSFARKFMVQRLPADAVPLVDRLEYFYDVDPGFGNGFPIDFQPDKELSLEFELPLVSLTPGIHRLFLRCMNESGNWSQVYTQNLLVQRIPVNLHYQLIRMEYFIDEDPGYGNGTSLEILPGSELTVSADLSLEALPDGMHTLYVRAEDNKGSWGQVFYQAFMKLTALTDITKVTSLEYFVNTDPGFGEGARVNLNTPKQSTMKYFKVDPADFQPGTNRLYVRALDSKGKWGMVYTTEFEVTTFEPCTPPSELAVGDVTDTSAAMGWTNQGSPVAWDLLYLPDGLDYTEDGILHSGIIENPSVENELMPSTLYNLYVRTICSDGQVSDWAGPKIFHTTPLPVNLLSLVADPPDGGTFTGEGSYEYGESINISANPNPHFVFNHWSGDTIYIGNILNPEATVIMPAVPVSLTAHFDEIIGLNQVPLISLRIFPNPATDQLNIDFNCTDQNTMKIKLLNTMGQIIGQKIVENDGLHKLSFQTSDLPSGIYLIIIQGNQWNSVHRVVIQH